MSSGVKKTSMEYFWYVAAALGAGVGTGLAGLSAATVMVPILIVLCPSFAGETGAYQATAVALASDILGSAVTAAVYIKHKNIDLRRGWVMLVCVLALCTAGSFAAWLAGNVVLGGFSLFLTFCIGVRFLVMPETRRREAGAAGVRLDAKGVAVSLFFGLTIGFGTGFVGTGGGMMMLVVFTAFLGYELKTAVGTSTFIMTFTALIASASHILINPAILLERWDALVICIVVATAASLVSAQFANRVKSRVVGLVTGGVLTALGGSMILLNYREQIMGCALLRQTLGCLGRFVLYIVAAAAILLAVHFTCRLPRELFRKMLHLPAFLSVVVLVESAENWMAASLAAAVFALILYPVLRLLEGWRGYDDLFVQRRAGEVKKSLLMLFLMLAGLIAICWGLLGRPWIAVTAVLMWGVGDAAAALVGKRLGKHPVRLPMADRKKTWEGSAAMTAAAFLAGTGCLLAYTALPWYICLLAALVTAPVAALTELMSHNGNDTVSVPAASAAVLWLLSLVMW